MIKKGTSMPLLLFALLLLGAVILISGCGQSEAEKAQETYDQDVADLKAAVQELQNPGTYDSLDSLKAAFQNVQTAYNDAVTSGKDVTNAKISQAQDAFDQLKEDITSIPSDQTFAEKLDAVNEAVQKFADEIDKI